MSIKNKGNALSQLSKAWIEVALLKLMRTKDYRKITISEIMEQAGLSHQTFHRNYYSKDDVLEGYFAKIWTEYEALISEVKDLTLPNIAGIFFKLVQKYFDFFALINNHHLFPLLLSKFDELWQPAFKELKVAQMPFSRESIEYALTFSAGGFIYLLIRWFNGKERQSPEAMATVMEDIISIFSHPKP